MSCKSSTYCPYPFIGASLQNDGIVFPCGQYMNIAPFKKNQPVEEVRNSLHMQEMRRQMMNNQTDSGCQCPAEEKAGILSMRQSAINQFGYQPFGPLKVVEIFFDNVCNLKCRMCSSGQSHLWFDEELELYGKTISPTKYIKNTLYSTLSISELEVIKIYGGEPLHTNEADLFFKRVIDQGKIQNLSIEISTNGTVLPMPNVLEAFLKCRSLRLNISIDAYGNLNEYIRSGSDWNVIVENMKFFDSLIDKRESETFISVHSAVGIYNINEISKLESFVSNNFPRFSKKKQMIQYPVFLNVQNTPKEYKSIIETFVDEPTKKYMYDGTTDFFPHFINFHRGLDKIRNESLKEANPLLHNFIANYKNVVDSKTFFLEQISSITNYDQS
jgi:MoaA/NifB/PqqE/SkfB family radical SAM enzyme